MSHESSSAGISADRLHSSLRRLGAVLLGALALLVPLSYGLAAGLPFGVRQEREVAALTAVVQAVTDPGSVREFLGRFVAGEAVFVEPGARALAYGALFLVATLAVIGALVCLRRAGEAVHAGTVQLLFRISVALGVVQIFAYPMFVQDFWISVAWGRMIAAGVNPYYEFFTAASLAGMPLEDFDLRMTYGPLWGLLSGLIGWFGSGHAVLEFFLFKGLLAAAWIGCVALIRGILQQASIRRQATAICLFGWMPMSSHMAIAEGHNDVVMVALLLLWVAASSRARLLAPVLLVASALVKYISAPVAALDGLRGARLLARGEKGAAARLVAGWAIAVLAAGAGVILFARDGEFFSATARMRHIRLLTPSQAVLDVCTRLGFSPGAHAVDAALVLLLFVPMIPVARRYWRNGREEERHVLLLAGLAAICWVVVGHTWPWFVLWPLAAACLVTSHGLTRWLLPLFLLAPFTHLYWILAPRPWDRPHVATVGLYAAYVVLLYPCRNLLAEKS